MVQISAAMARGDTEGVQKAQENTIASNTPKGTFLGISPSGVAVRGTSIRILISSGPAPKPKKKDDEDKKDDKPADKPKPTPTPTRRR